MFPHGFREDTDSGQWSILHKRMHNRNIVKAQKMLAIIIIIIEE